MLSDQEYVEKRGLACPFCKSASLEWDEIEVDGTDAQQEVYCHNCGAAWLDVYSLSGYAVVTWPDPSVLATLEKPAS